MIISRDREKLIQAIVFFTKKTKHPHTMKLFKLLNFLDFEHYRQTGRTVTGLKYAAWERGPVPPALWREIQDGLGKDLSDAISIVTENDSVTQATMRRDIKPRIDFRTSLFTKRELAIMERLAEIFQDARGDTMSDWSHFKGLPWKRVWNGGKGKGDPIPPELALDAEPLDRDVPTIERDEIQLHADLRRGLA